MPKVKINIEIEYNLDNRGNAINEINDYIDELYRIREEILKIGEQNED